MMSDSEQAQRGTHESIKAALRDLSQLDRQERTELLTDVVKNVIPVSVQKDVATVATQDLPPTDKKDVATAATQGLSPADKKDVATMATEGLSPDDKKDVATMAAQDLPPEQRKTVANAATQGLPPDDKKDVTLNAVQTLPEGAKQEVQQAAGNPSQRVTDKIWMIVVGTFAAVLFISALALLYVAVWPPQNTSDSTQVLLPVFTSIAGILAGFISGRASASGSSR
jgi:hypothetical protein